MVLDAVAEKYSDLWRNVEKFNARMVEFDVGGEKVLLVKPLSFYNDTGAVARKLIDFYKANANTDLIVLHDDLSLPFGTIRTRERGSDAGNNGIKSLNTYLGEEYPRIRIGIWTELRDQMDDVGFVLGKFSHPEAKKLEKDIIPHAVALVDAFLAGTLEQTSHKL